MQDWQKPFVEWRGDLKDNAVWRELDLAKPPGVAETIDWVATLGFLGESELTEASASDTIGAVIKDRDDLDLVREQLAEITSGA